jgi:ribonuclease HI
MAISESLTSINGMQGRNFSIFSDPRSVPTAISSTINFGKRSPLISCIKEQLEETQAAGKPVRIHWIPAHRGTTGNEKADELAKHSIRHGRDSRIPIPAEDMKSLWRRKSREESQQWHQEVGQGRGRKYFTLFHDKDPNPWFAKCKLNRRAATSICRLRSGNTALAQSGTLQYRAMRSI